MANEQNLRPGEYRLSREEAKKGGIASGKTRRRQADLRKAAQAALNGTYTTQDGETLTGEELVIKSIIENIANGKGRNYGKALEAIITLTGAKESDVDRRKKEAEADILEVEAERAKAGGNEDGVTIVWGRE